MLYVRLIEATHVPRLDWYTRPSPYVQLSVRDKRPRSSKVLNTTHPQYVPNHSNCIDICFICIIEQGLFCNADSGAMCSCL